MNPWLWLLFGIACAVVLFVVSAAVVAIVEAIRTPDPCDMCGYVDGGDESAPSATSWHMRDLS